MTTETQTIEQRVRELAEAALCDHYEQRSVDTGECEHNAAWRQFCVESPQIIACLARVAGAARELVPGAFAFLYDSPYHNRYYALRVALESLDRATVQHNSQQEGE